MKNAQVSRFKNYMSKAPTKTNLWEWLNDDTYKNIVEDIRAIDDKDARNKLKKNLPAITVSGVFSTRSLSGLIKHSGFICIDIDSGDNPDITDFENLRDQLKNVLNVAYSGLSVSGKGVFCLIPIMYPDKHKEHFEALKICFEKLGIIVDKACSDVSRLRGYSYDVSAYFNENAVVFNQTLDFKILKQKTKLIVERKISQNTFNPVKKNYRFNQIVSKAFETKTDLTDKYDDWFRICCALVNEFGEEGRDSFHLLSSLNINYLQHQTDNLFSECLANNHKYIGTSREVKIGTFFHLAKEYGIV